MIIGLTGTLGAGKGTIVDFLKEKGFRHYSVREFLIEEINKRGLPVNRDSMVLVANQLREINSPSYIIEKLMEKAEQQGGNSIIESIRTQGEAEKIKEKGILLAVDADQRTRYSRTLDRQSETDNISFEKFVEDERREMFSTDPNKQNLSQCIKMAEFVINNDGTIEELNKQVEEVYGKVCSAGPEKISKREDYISWDEYFMGIAMLSAMRSKDPNTNVGAAIITPNKKIVGIGYNGFPIGCSDDNLPWDRKGEFLDTKYPYVCHAELNAILNSRGHNLENCSIYVALFPCNECAKAIIQSGIKEVVYLSDKYAEEDITKAAKKMFSMAGIKTRKIVINKPFIKIDFRSDN